MRDQFLMTAGVLAMVLSLVHGWLSHRHLLPRIEVHPVSMKRLNAGVYQLSTLYWFAGGVALVLAPGQPEPARQVIVMGTGLMYASAVAVNFWATRGRHFGAYLFAIVVMLCIAGH